MSEEEISTVLNTYMYIDYREADDGMSLNEIVEELASSPDCHPGGIHYGEYQVLSSAAKDPELGSLLIGNQSHLMDFDKGTIACTFQSPDKNRCYIVYRGTSDGEWPDNGNGMTQVSTIQQKRALDYYETVIERMQITKEQRLVVTGHSKGGNKAQYVLMSTQYGELADVCYNIDGQGFSEKAIKEWQRCYGEQEYEKRRSKIVGVYGENDYVNVLGYSIVPKEQIRFVKTPALKSDIAGYHDIKYMFAKQVYHPKTGKTEIVFDGKRNGYAFRRGELGNYAAQLSEDMMKLPETKLDGCAAVSMHLMEVMRGSAEGINNEKLSLYDADDFVAKGPELIMGSLLFSGSGTDLLHGIFFKNSFGTGMQGDVNFAIKEEKLKQQAKELQNLSLLIQKESSRLSEVQEALARAMRGNFQIKQQLLAEERELKKLTLSFQRSATLLMEIVGAYKSSDEAVSNS